MDFLEKNPGNFYDSEGHNPDNINQRRRIKKTFKFLGNNFFGKKILDIGSGNGLLSQKLGQQVFSVDISRNKLLAGAGNKKIQADIKELPFLSGAFDTVFALEILEHVTDWQQALREILRVGKKVIVTVPYQEEVIQIYCSFCGKKTPQDGHINIFDEDTFFISQVSSQIEYIGSVNYIHDYVWKCLKMFLCIFFKKNSSNSKIRTSCVHCGHPVSCSKVVVIKKRIRRILSRKPDWIMYIIDNDY